MVPPQALRSASNHLPRITNPTIKLKVFKSGLTVLHTSRFDEENFSQRLEVHLRKKEEVAIEEEEESSMGLKFGCGSSALELSSIEGVPLNLLNEILESCEIKFGNVLRDDGGRQGTRWFTNRFQELI